MNNRWIFLFAAIGLLALFAAAVSPTQAANGDCEAYATSSVPMESSTSIDFTCNADATVYFGVCDSGGVPNDDLFNIVFSGQVVSYNYYPNATDEYTVLGEAQLAAGSYTAEMNSLNSTPFPPATYSYGVSTNAGDVVNYLQTYCGTDWKGVGPGVSASCDTNVPVFTMDAAPSDGTLEFHVLFGNEGARGDEIIFMTWDISEGDQINNAMVTNLPAPRYARLWWSPDGSSDWYLLTSQYWHGGGSTADQYGITCSGGQPSYHTSFSSAVPEADVCFDLLNGC